VVDRAEARRLFVAADMDGDETLDPAEVKTLVEQLTSMQVCD
jgi:hypothetical protein